MPVPVLLALTMVGGVAVVVFLSSRRRLSTWLLIASLGLFVTGGVMWAHEPSHPHPLATGFVALAPTAALTAPDDVAGDVYSTEESTGSAVREGVTLTFSAGDTVVPVDTGSGPNHLPAIVVLALAVAVGLIGVVMKRRTPRAEAS